MRLLAPLLLVCLATAAHAQPTEREFFFAFLGIDDPDALALGTAPDDLRPFLPDGADVLGTLSRTSFLGFSDIVVARTEGAPAVALEGLGEAVGGWERAVPSGDREMRGFVSPQRAADENASYYRTEGDGDVSVVQVLASEAPSGGAYVRVIRRDVRPNEWAPGREDRSARFGAADPIQSVLPRLVAPEGVTMTGGGAGGGGGSFGSSAQLNGDLPLDDLAAHYHEQIRAEGWTAVGETAEDDVVASAWTRRDGSAVYVLTFSAQRSGPGRYDLVAVVAGPERRG